MGRTELGNFRLGVRDLFIFDRLVGERSEGKRGRRLSSCALFVRHSFASCPFENRVLFDSLNDFLRTWMQVRPESRAKLGTRLPTSVRKDVRGRNVSLVSFF